MKGVIRQAVRINLGASSGHYGVACPSGHIFLAGMDCSSRGKLKRIRKVQNFLIEWSRPSVLAIWRAGESEVGAPPHGR